MRKLIEAKGVIKTYVVGSTTINALNGVDFEVEEGEFVVILGASGAGKTTLLNLIGGMDTLTSGELIVDGRDIGQYNRKQLTEYRRNDVGFVFQFYNLMPNLTALENVEIATEMCRNALSPEKVLEAVGLKDRMANFPGQLSGGEQQRVSIARALAKNPRLLLCDEPTGALDYATGKTILKLLQDACKQHHKTVVVVTHNSALKDMADKVVYVKNGLATKVERNAAPKDIAEIEW
ncbi:MAG: ABC transporter ATP-binding protein [Clostridia bacterium]|nr:ABC transporter ATP-binding protein [Clostridia bacterium]